MGLHKIFALCSFHQRVCGNINHPGCLSAAICTQPVSLLPVHSAETNKASLQVCTAALPSALRSFHLPTTCLLITQISETTSQKMGRFLPQAFAPQVDIQMHSPDNRLTSSVFPRCQAFFCASPVLAHLIIKCVNTIIPIVQMSKLRQISSIRHTRSMCLKVQ